MNQDLAIDLRVRLGDWFRVIQLAHGANEALMGWVAADLMIKWGFNRDCLSNPILNPTVILSTVIQSIYLSI